LGRNAVSKPKPTKSGGTWIASGGADDAMESCIAELGNEGHAEDEVPADDATEDEVAKEVEYVSGFH
jgi:hypothetical protein